jgi:sulfonate transport system substrate-binding protein
MPATALSRRSFVTAALAAPAISGGRALAAPPGEIAIDWATYNPVSLILKQQGLLEKALKTDGIGVRWVYSAGSNKALEFLNAGSLDFGSTAGAAALLGAVNGNPIRSVYVYSRPEWTALVTKSEAIKGVGDLKGKRVAVTRGTDPHIFLVRAIAEAKLTEREVKFVLLQHADGRAAMERGDVDAWAGLDPMMAAAEVESGARLFHRRPDLNTWGVLNVREAFASEHPGLVTRVLEAYEAARKVARGNPQLVAEALKVATRLPDAVIARQIARTELTHSEIGPAQAETIRAAGLALRDAGIIKPDVDVAAVVARLIDPRFLGKRPA